MTAQPVQANAVVSATNLNPSVFNQVWLVQNGIIPAPGDNDGTSDGQVHSVFTDVVVQAQTSAFTLQVVPQQLLLLPKILDVSAGTLVREKLQRIVGLLPHVPYVAAGLNFVWQSEPIQDMGPLCRMLFAGSGAPFNSFGGADSRFGIYVSRDVGLTRMRVDIRPASLRDEMPKRERLIFTFNFERTLEADADKAKAIVDVMSGWDEYRRMAGELVAETLVRTS
jgi:hypothetical protein